MLRATNSGAAMANVQMMVRGGFRLALGADRLSMPDGLDKRRRSTQMLRAFHRWGQRGMMLNFVVLWYYYTSFGFWIYHRAVEALPEEFVFIYQADRPIEAVLFSLALGWIGAQVFLQTLHLIHRKMTGVVLADHQRAEDDKFYDEWF
jgi:hypothetical protein